MFKKIESLINESIKLELLLSELYWHFKTQCTEDKEFWEQISGEEIEHAELLRKSKGFIDSKKGFPIEILPKDIDEIKITIKKIKKSHIKFQKNPGRNNALKIALSLENSLTEVHYQKFMTTDSDSWIANVFKILNGADKDHIKRIKKYMQDKMLLRI